jgi:hypothetical protein
MDEIVQDIIAEFAWGSRGPYHRHAPRFEECVHIADQIHSSSLFLLWMVVHEKIDPAPERSSLFYHDQLPFSTIKLRFFA